MFYWWPTADGLRSIVKTLLKTFLADKSNPLVQFAKYGLAGGIATATDLICFRFFALFLSPDIESNLPDTVRARNFVIDNLLAFGISNFVAYVLNVLWVFKPGRHSKWVEIGLFYAVSGTSVFIGILLGGLMIDHWGWDGNSAWFAKLVASMLINFVLRRYLIFKR